MADKRHATRAQAEQVVQQMLDAGLPESEIRAAMADVMIDGQDTIPVSRPQTWWDKHPRTREVARGALATLPVMGAVGGGVVGGGTTLGAGTLPGAAVGAGVGEAVREAIGESLGINPRTSMKEKGAGILGTAAMTGAGGLAEQGLANVTLNPAKGARMLARRIPGVRDVMDVAEMARGEAPVAPTSPSATTRTAETMGMSRPSIATSPESVNSPLGRQLQPDRFTRPLSSMSGAKPETSPPITGMPRGVRMQVEQPVTSVVDPRVTPSDAELASARGRSYAAGRKPAYRDVPPLATTPEGAMPKESFQQLRESVLSEFKPSERVAAKRIMDEEIDLMPLLDRGPTNAQARAAERFGRIYRSETGEISPETAIGTVVAGAGGAYAAKKLYDFVREKLSEANKQMNPFQIYADKLKGQ